MDTSSTVSATGLLFTFLNVCWLLTGGYSIMMFSKAVFICFEKFSCHMNSQCTLLNKLL